MTTTCACPFCGGRAYGLEWLSICSVCSRRWETAYTEKLREEYKGGINHGSKTETEKEDGEGTAGDGKQETQG